MLSLLETGEGVSLAVDSADVESLRDGKRRTTGVTQAVVAILLPTGAVQEEAGGVFSSGGIYQDARTEATCIQWGVVYKQICPTLVGCLAEATRRTLHKYRGYRSRGPINFR